MTSSARASRVLLFSVPENAADAAPGTVRIRRYRLARVRCGARAGVTGAAGTPVPDSKPGN